MIPIAIYYESFDYLPPSAVYLDVTKKEFLAYRADNVWNGWSLRDNLPLFGVMGLTAIVGVRI